MVRVYTERGLRKAAAAGNGGGEHFAGSETIEGVMDELGEKEGGPQ